MSQLYVDNIKNRTGGAIGAPAGIVVSGVGTFSGNVSIGGTLSYEDVTNIDSVGIITARSDISIADKIVHTGDTNTAIRFPAADTFTVETAGSEALRIDSSGRLLAGATVEGAPAADNLTLQDSGSCGLTIRGGTSDYSTIYLSNATSGAGEYSGSLQYSHADNSLRIGTDSVERLRITSSGNLISTGTISDSIGPLRRLGVNAQSGAYAFVVGDAGKIIRSAGSGAALTLNQNIFTAGDMISVFNVGSGTNTVVQGTGVTLYNTADAATGTRTIAAKGMVTIVCTASNEFAISGSQLT